MSDNGFLSRISRTRTVDAGLTALLPGPPVPSPPVEDLLFENSSVRLNVKEPQLVSI
jgi:hypothetical protein